MTDFNLKTLSNFRPARLLCQKCLALLIHTPLVKAGQNPKCPVCSVEYVPTTQYTRYHLDEYLTDSGCGVKFDDLLRHCIDLARATTSLVYDPMPPLRMLLEALNRAEQFVHFASFGISEFFVGALKLIAQRVDVRGIVSNADERTKDEFTSFKTDAPSGRLEVMHFLRGEPWEDAPHQKLIVIDGLLAFKGSTNLTLHGWRQVARGRDHVEVVASVNEVIELHNTLFSRVWATRREYGPSIEMNRVPF